MPSDQPNSKQPAGTPSPAAMAHSQPEGAWREFVDHAFFAPCARHAACCSARDSTTNWWSFTSHQPACSVCVAGSPLETYIQVRRSSYHDVVKMADISRFADIAGIQGYTINSSKVIFLRRRPQPRPPKGAVGASLCSVCSRHLQDVSQFCSLQCKLDSMAGVKHVSLRPVDIAAAAPTEALSTGSSVACSARSAGPDTPLHPASLRALEVATASDSECMAEFHGPPTKRRKGCPLRAPSE